MNFKTLSLITILIILIFVAATVLANIQNASIKIPASEMCKENIEAVAETVKGVKRAVWDEETQELEILFNNTETNINKIEKVISEAGYDTPKHLATDETNSQLPKDCQMRDKDNSKPAKATLNN